MTIHISFDPTSQEDVEYVLALIQDDPAARQYLSQDDPAARQYEEEAPTPRKSRAKAADPEPEPDAEPTMEDAVARATELVSEGRTADVKGALANLGVKRVSELEESQIAEFLEAVSEDNLV